MDDDAVAVGPRSRGIRVLASDGPCGFYGTPSDDELRLRCARARARARTNGSKPFRGTDWNGLLRYDAIYDE